ncbi:MAG: tryptophan synthase susbunit alpha [Nitrospira bacterium SG8_3]|nr:MAG: tryptophan synthase susbunit alpha [Nitrospira bacterium SG8_3]
MTHIVLGYPSLKDSYRIVETMVEAGVDLMELQIPFSDPIADGPVILHANQKALEMGATVKGCLVAAKEITQSFQIPFLIMSYYNIFFRHGIQRFVSTMARSGLRGAIIPDLPPEEGETYLEAMAEKSLAPILIFSPTTSLERMKYLNTMARGFVYCVSRKGVTGENTDFSETLNNYIARCRGATSLPLAVGFGIKEKGDIDFLRGKVDIAVVGTQTLRIMEEQGNAAVGDFIRGLR